MNDRLTDITFIAVFLLLIGVFISWSFDTGRERVLPLETHEYSGEDGARRAVSDLRNFLIPGKSINEAPGDFTYRLREGVAVHVDTREVIRRAGEAAETETAGPHGKRRLAGVLGEINRAIATYRYRIEAAKKEKSRSPEEISRAEKALGEMIRGANMLTERIESSGNNPLP